MRTRRLVLRRLSHLLLLLLALPLAAPAIQAEELPLEGDLLVGPWLGLPPIDRGGRVPFRPSRTFERHVLDPGSAPPAAGETLGSLRGREAAWAPLEIDEKGRVVSKGMAWAYAPVYVKEAGIWLAEIRNASAVFVNGTAHDGDVYGHGITRTPVFVEKGKNHLFAVGFRGPFSVTLEAPPGPLFLASWDATLPDLPEGETVRPHAGILVVNASDEPVQGVSVEATASAGTQRVAAGFRIPMIPPLGQVKIPLVMEKGLSVPPDAENGSLEVLIADCDEVIDLMTFDLPIRKAGEPYRRTFVSGIDRSVQTYAVRPPAGEMEEGAEMGLVLSLHGAGVDALNQAKAYGPKTDFWIVAATNRRPFGFDWQDWGRRDAYEVLGDALRLTGVDRRHVHLTGHSMGGHGTWHLAANDPDGFASIAPSAGWRSFETYAGGRDNSPLSALWLASDGASDTESLLDNLAQLPIYILHGEKDDNVPASEARAMEAALKNKANELHAHYEKDAGHWWDGHPEPGAACVDWPGFFEMFRRHRIPANPARLELKTVEPGVDAQHHWMRIEQPLQYGITADAVVDWDDETKTLRVETRNVRRLHLDVPGGARPARLLVGETPLPVPEEPGTLELVWRDGKVTTGLASLPANEKSSTRTGPFKRAFENGFVLVYGTAGDERTDRAWRERARFDAERWRYRANGYAETVSDVYFLANPHRYAGRNVILYGNADTNRAWKNLLASSPILFTQGKVIAGKRSWEGDDLAGLFVRPRDDDAKGLVGVVAASGVKGLRLTIPSPYLRSGVGLPDYVVFGPDVLHLGDIGVKVAGFFDVTWNLADG